MAPECAQYPNVKSEAYTLSSLSRAWFRVWGSTVWVRKKFPDVRADFVVILGMLHENRRNLSSEWAFGRAFAPTHVLPCGCFTKCSIYVIFTACPVNATGKMKSCYLALHVNNLTTLHVAASRENASWRVLVARIFSRFEALRRSMRPT